MAFAALGVVAEQKPSLIIERVRTGIRKARAKGKTRVEEAALDPRAFAGVDRVRSRFTLMSGYEELSTWLTRCFVTTEMPPFVSLDVLPTSQVTFGVFRGTRPYTSRSSSSMICGRRTFHYISALVIRLPSLSNSGPAGSGSVQVGSASVPKAA